jgi:hypothetical protein
MGYFANGTDGMAFEDYYCSRCIHYLKCAVWEAHIIHNYNECNNKDSILHMLIPRDEHGYNQKCKMCHEVKEAG